MPKNAVTTTAQVEAPPRLNSEHYRRLLATDQAIEATDHGLAVSHERAPTHEERERYQRREILLRTCVRYRDPARTALAIANMFTAMGTYYASNEEAAAKVNEYANVVGDLPAWAVEHACQTWARGGYGIDHRAPTAAELHNKAKAEVEPFWREQEAIARILRAEVLPPVRRMTNEQVDAMVAQAKGRIVDGSYMAEQKAARSAEYDKWAEANDDRLRQRDEAHRAETEAARKAASTAEARG